jgi:hypothetical protein
MFEEELELEKKEGSSYGPVVVALLLVVLFIGGIGVVIYQSNVAIKPAEATAAIDTKLKTMEPVTVSFRTGNVSYSAIYPPNDPQYKLFEKAGLLKIGKGKGYAGQVDLTDAGKKFLADFPAVKGVPNIDNSALTYTIPLASRKLVSVGKITKVAQKTFQVQYTWTWVPTTAGDMFDIDGKLVQGLPLYERGELIDHHGAKYYHGAPQQASIVLVKGDHGWEPAAGN